MKRLAILAAAGLFVAGCTNDPSLNAATGALAGAAIGSQFGQAEGRVGATLAGAAIGTAIGASQPTQRNCLYRNTRTGEVFEAPCQ
ncbi:MAG: glycine zipper 2TM domain-containing protein [Rhodobacteraceae bacterium]|nr:glycine zipper 2TM domain-containing protein [Paracoccaceae bacterium]